jgi:hypothetical protein
MFGKKEQHA